MFDLTKDYWLGDEASLRDALALEARIETAAAARGYQVSASADAAGGDAAPRLYSRNGNVGVITVRGPLINSENPFMALFGVSTYPAIREALVYAAQDEAVDKILMDIDSPGGAVSGVNDTAKLVKRVDGIKAITVHSDNVLASAAYWIASGASKINVGDVAVVGSIGVIATMASQHEALKKEGVQVAVVRAGKNKALGHPAEPISEKAIAQVQERVDATYNVFTDTVASNRSKLPLAKKGTWAEGNEFLGADAVDSGLADKVATFDETYASLVKSVDHARADNNNADKTRGMQMKPRATLDLQLVAKIQAGAALTEAEQAAVTAAAATAEAATEAAAQAASAEADAAATAAAAAAAEAAAAAAAPAAAASAQGSELVAFLQTELKAANEKVLALTLEKSGLDAKVADMGAAHAKLCEIARNSINTMSVALGGHKGSLEALTGTELVARHATMQSDFEKAFPVGGRAVASTEGAAQEEAAATEPSARHLQLVHAVGLSKNKNK